MRIIKYASHVLLSLTLGAGLSIASAVLAKDNAAKDETAMPAIQPGNLYLSSIDPVADLAAKLESARQSHKRLLVVMGGNWCHDSRALASRLFSEPLSATINQHYEILFVDVGYLEKGRDVITSLGIPVYYATPTLLIVDPVSGLVVNAQDRHQWAEAASISMEDSLAYFRQYQDAGQTAIEDNSDAQLQELLAEIDAFEATQAERLYQAYAVLGPMLKAYKEVTRRRSRKISGARSAITATRFPPTSGSCGPKRVNGWRQATPVSGWTTRFIRRFPGKRNNRPSA